MGILREHEHYLWYDYSLYEEIAHWYQYRSYHAISERKAIFFAKKAESYYKEAETIRRNPNTNRRPER